jgi:hypothetical protein
MELTTINLSDLNDGPAIQLMTDAQDANVSNPVSNPASLPGIELLMNNKNKEKDILDSTYVELENDLELLSMPDVSNNTSQFPTQKAQFPEHNTQFPEHNTQFPQHNTQFPQHNTQFPMMNTFTHVPPVPDIYPQQDTLKEKFKYIHKLEELQKKGAKLSKQYDMESSLTEMQVEYDTLISDKESSNSIKFQGKALMALITGFEFLNNKFDPFDIKLDGWGEQVNENISDYDDIFSELHDKYKSKAKMGPELRLLFSLSSSALLIHMTNGVFKSAMPGMDDIMRQNPDLMQQFSQAAVNNISETKPGFGSFMNNVVNNGANKSHDTQQMFNPQLSKRPDLANARQSQVGEDISSSFSNVAEQSKSMRKPRPDMSGPTDDLKALLAGVKKTDEDTSVISLSDLQEISNSNKPTKPASKRKSKSNTMSVCL